MVLDWLKEKLSQIRDNHALLMILCCAIPLALLAAVYALGWNSNPYIAFLLILACPVSHVLLHAGHSMGGDKKSCHGEGKEEKPGRGGGKEEKPCHEDGKKEEGKPNGEGMPK